MTLVLKNSRLELESAEEFYLSLQEAQTFAEAEKAWQNFLGALERTWKKTEYVMSSSSHYKGWRGNYIERRRNDSLLSYLKNARDAREHTISEAVGVRFSDTPLAHTYLVGADGSQLSILETPGLKMIMEQEGLTVDTVVHVASTEKSMFKPEQMCLNIVHNRGTAYSPPVEHLGKQLQNNDPISVAEFGLKFYRSFIEEVEERFSDEGI